MRHERSLEAGVHVTPGEAPRAPLLEVRGGLLARNTGMNLVGMGLPPLLALLLLPPVISGLGIESFGVLAIAWMILSYFSDFGFGRATTKFVAEVLGSGEEERLAGIVWGTVLVQLAVGLLAAAGLAASAGLLAERVFRIPAALQGEARLSLQLLALAIPVMMVSSALRGVLEAAQRFDLVNAVRIPSSLANYVLPFLAVLAGFRLPGIFVLLVLGRIGTAAAHYVLSRRLLPATRRLTLPAPAEWRALIGFGGWIGVSSIVSPVLVYLDRFLLGVLLTVGAVGYYFAPFEVVVRLLLIPSALVSTLFPAFSTLDGLRDGARIQELVAKAVKLLLLTLGPVVILIVAGAEDLLRLWLGEDFARESGLALRILAVGLMINALAYVPHGLIQGVGRADLTAKFHLLELPIHVVLVWVMVSAWGITGAAVAWTLRVTIDAVLLFGAAAFLSRISLASFLRERVPQAAAVVLAFGATCVVAAAWLPTVLLRAGLVAALLALMARVTWVYSMGEGDRARVVRALGLLRSRAA